MTQAVTKEDFMDPVYFQVGYLNQIPHKKQIKILRSKSKYKIICAGRRGGKTQMIAGEAIRGATLQIYKKQFVVAPTYKQVKIVYSKIIDVMTKAGLLGDLTKYPESPRPMILWNNGSVIEFGSADRPETLRGEGYDRIFEDESGFLKDSARQAIRPMAFDTGAPIWKISTPWSTKSNFHDDYQRGKKLEGGYESFHFTSLDNPYIDQATVLAEIEEYGRDHPYIISEIFAEFIEDVDSFFGRDLIDNCKSDYLMIGRERVYT